MLESWSEDMAMSWIGREAAARCKRLVLYYTYVQNYT